MTVLKKLTKLLGFWALALCLQLVPCSGYSDEPGETVSSREVGAAERSEKSLIDKRLAAEKETNDFSFMLTPHRPNYLLPVNYNSTVNTAVYKGTAAENIDLDHVEIKFQISIKYLLLDNLMNPDVDVYIAYSTLSYWQAYNKHNSSPFRDTNHEPEAWVQWNTDRKILGVRCKLMQLGMWHQSNGRVEPISRSWNRVYANIIFEKGPWAFGIKPWYRIPEDEENDNNPDIERYYGHGELRAAYKKKDHTLTFLLRNNARKSNNKGAVELGWSFPLYKNKKLKGYVQYFNGYGQTILDYNHSSNTLGMGLALSDIL